MRVMHLTVTRSASEAEIVSDSRDWEIFSFRVAWLHPPAPSRDGRGPLKPHLPRRPVLT
jgi:hypothetical protein